MRFREENGKNRIKEFFRYVLPSMGAMLFNALYSVVDGVFVGKGVGSLGLAAVNLALPFIGLAGAIAVMLVMGAATISAVSIGQKRYDKANAVFNNACLVVGALAVVFSVVLCALADHFARLSGAEGELMRLTAIYIRSYMGFGVFFCASFLLSAFVRNDGDPGLAFVGMLSGTLCNIFLDWLFIFPLNLGIFGAGFASGLSTVVSFSILMLHFVKKRGILRFTKPRFSWSLTCESVKRGFPAFVTEIYGPVTIQCYNMVIMASYGDFGVSAFSMIGYLLWVMLALISGVAQGVQPLVSVSYGEKNHRAERFYLNCGLVLNIILAVFMYAASVLFGQQAYSIFSDDKALIDLACEGSIYIGASMVISAVNICYTSYFLATQRTGQSLLLAVSRAFIFAIPCIMLMPALFGKSAVWSGMIVSEAFVAILAIILYIHLVRSERIDGGQ